MANTIGIVVHFIEASFFPEWDMGKGHGGWSMEIDMMGNIWMIKRMEEEYTYGNQVIDTKDNLKMITDMDMERCIGMMGQVLKANG